MVCNPLGKSGGSAIQQLMIIGFGSLAASTPYLGAILLAVVLAWLAAASSLNKQARPHAPEAAAALASRGRCLAQCRWRCYLQKDPQLCQLPLPALWAALSLIGSHRLILIMPAAARARREAVCMPEVVAGHACTDTTGP